MNLKDVAAHGPKALRDLTRAFRALKEIDEAAAVVAAGKGEAALTQAKAGLSHLAAAVESILGEMHSVVKRTSKSTGTERLAFVVGEVTTDLKAGIKEFGENSVILRKSDEVLEYLRSKGINAEQVLLHSDKPGHIRHAVDVVLDDRIIKFVPGDKTAAVVKRSQAKRSGPGE